MAVFLNFLSKRKVNENGKFCIVSYEYEFFLTDYIETCEWPLVFSEHILDKIKENFPSNAHIGLTIKNEDILGHIPFMPLSKLTPTVFDEHFHKIFYDVQKLSGTLKMEVSFVSIPSCYIR